jgi:hypothetical protein
VLALVAGLCTRALALRGQSFAVSATTPVAVLLPSSGKAGECVLRGAAGTWHEIEPVAAGPALRFDVGVADASAPGGALLVTDKPEWMVLEDDAPPKLVSAWADERPLSVSSGCVQAGVVPPMGLTLAFAVADAANPLDSRVQWALTGSLPGPPPVLKTEGLEGQSRAGRIGLTFAALPAGTWQGRVLVRDRSPWSHTLAIQWSFTVPGIQPLADRKAVRLATAAGEFLFQPGREQQLRLPDGRWAKLTTRHGNTWLYPREITEIRGPETLPWGQRASVLANTQDIEGKPVEGLARLEYEFTVRADVPALLVLTRAVNVQTEAAKMEANWGWLPGAYYVLPAGRREWTGKQTDRYIAIGTPGWLWLAPASAQTQGLAWVSSLAFGESRFDTMLLYGAGRTCEPGQSVDIGFALAPVETPEDAAALAAQCATLGIVE